MGVYPNYGGVEKVTTILSNKLVDLGYSISIISFEQPFLELANELNPKVKIYKFPHKSVLNLKNINFMREILINNNINIIINQWCLPYPVTLLCNQAMRGTQCKKLLAVHHNMPDNNSLIQKYNILLKKHGGLKNKLLLNFSKILTGLSLNLVYKNSTSYILLSPRFIGNFKNITKIKKIDKIRSITNPLTIAENKDFDFSLKENILLYVGRIDYNQKRVSRLIDVWEQLSKKHCDWKFIVVGDGPELPDIIRIANEKKLKNIYFEGFKSPEDYYKKTKILIMSSEYEGLPLVLCEAMNYGVVPVVYNSFQTASEIINHDINGILVDPMNGSFDTSQMVLAISKLIEDNNLLEISKSAYLKSKLYDLDNVVQQWIELFNEEE